MKLRFFYIILLSLSSCTLFIDRKNVIKSIPGEWDLILIKDLDTFNGIAKFTFKKIDNDNYIRDFEFRDKHNNLMSKGYYLTFGIGGSTYLHYKDSISKLHFKGEVVDFIYHSNKTSQKRPIRYIEVIDTLRTTNTIVKMQITDN